MLKLPAYRLCLRVNSRIDGDAVRVSGHVEARGNCIDQRTARVVVALTIGFEGFAYADPNLGAC